MATRASRAGANFARSVRPPRTAPISSTSSFKGGKAFAGLAGFGLGCSAFALGYLQQDLAAESEHASVFTWGSDQYGQLGDGGETDILVPEAVQDLDTKNIVQISACGNSTAALSANGDVYTFGCGMHSRLGHGFSLHQENEILPRKIEQLGPCTQVEIGEYHGGVVTADGKLYTWGRDLSGMLGHQNTNKGHPNLVAGALEKEKVVGVSCGLKHTAAITESGKLFTWGSAREGALGHGNEKRAVKEPKQVEALAGARVVEISCGRDSTLARTEDGKLYVFGANDYGQVGVGKNKRYQRSPALLRRIPEVVQVAAGGFHAVALTKDGNVYTWGFGTDGQTGHATTSNTAIPKLVEDLKEKNVIKVAAGGAHTACITDKGEVYMFGRGRNGQLAQGDQLASVAASRTEPVKVNFFDANQVLEIALGKEHSVALARPKNNPPAQE